MASPYDRPVHKVTVKEETLLADIIGAGEHGVNSYHHQAVKDLAPKAEAMAYSEDGLVEAIAVPDKTFIVGVQWHPEILGLGDKVANNLFTAFVEACAQNMK